MVCYITRVMTAFQIGFSYKRNRNSFTGFSSNRGSILETYRVSDEYTLK